MNIWLIDPAPELNELFQAKGSDCALRSFDTSEEVIDTLRHSKVECHCVVIDATRNKNALYLLKTLKGHFPKIIRVLAGIADFDLLIDAINEAQIFQHISAPYTPDKVLACLTKVGAEIDKRNLLAQEELSTLLLWHHQVIEQRSQWLTSLVKGDEALEQRMAAFIDDQVCLVNDFYEVNMVDKLLYEKGGGLKRQFLSRIFEDVSKMGLEPLETIAQKLEETGVIECSVESNKPSLKFSGAPPSLNIFHPLAHGAMRNHRAMSLIVQLYLVSAEGVSVQ